MLSNKLTFSLVFVCALAFVFAALPAAAQTYYLDVGAQAGIKGKFLVATDGDPTVAVQGFIPDDSTTANVTEGPMVLNTLVDAVVDDLYEFFRDGGTIEVLMRVKGETIITAANAGKQAEIDKLKHAVFVSEVMWGRTLTATAQNSDGRWLELYFHSLGTKDANKKDIAAAEVLLAFHDRKQQRLLTKVSVPGSTAADGTGTGIDENGAGDGVGSADYIVVDTVSRVPRFGAAWELPGQDGNDAPFEQAGEVVAAQPLKSMYRKADLVAGAYKADLGGVGFGTEGGSWIQSEGQNAYISGNFIGSPGSVHVSLGGEATRFSKTPGSISATGVIINEVRNDTSEANLDWIELFYNTEDSAATSQNVENWELSIVTDNKTDKSLAVLPKYKMPPGGYLVVYNRDPGKSVTLAGGVNLQDVIDGKHVNKGASHMYVVASDLDLPNTGKFLILLRTRNHNDDVGKPTNIKDYVGNGFFQRIEPNKFDTDVWPFVGWAKPAAAGFGDGTFASRNQSWGRKVKLNKNGDYWAHSRANDRGHGDDWTKFDFIGAGYDRGRDKVVDTVTSPGTPGYPNVAVNVVADDRDTTSGTDDYAFDGQVSISEIMYDAGPRWNLVQWIELYNSSMTETVKLDGWEFEIRNESTDIESYVDASFEFAAGAMIPPNQTLLLVSSTGTNDVPANYVYNLASNHVKELGLNTRGRRLLSNVGFHLELRAKVNKAGKTEMMTVDQVGNVMVDGAARQHMWDLPNVDASGQRRSIVRVYGTQAIGDGAEPPSDGLDVASWNLSDLTGASLTFYGHRDDVSTPGFRLGGPLPVELSTFRPVRNETTGHVDITWVTQSELNNAGFNILRSETKTGDFKVVNVKGIVAGHGTTSEKHVYTFTDTTAKPNVVYYYQIEDVSLDGKRTTLATTHLRGNVNAAGKLTTTWGDLKTQQ